MDVRNVIAQLYVFNKEACQLTDNPNWLDDILSFLTFSKECASNGNLENAIVWHVMLILVSDDQTFKDYIINVVTPRAEKFKNEGVPFVIPTDVGCFKSILNKFSCFRAAENAVNNLDKKATGMVNNVNNQVNNVSNTLNKEVNDISKTVTTSADKFTSQMTNVTGNFNGQVDRATNNMSNQMTRVKNQVSNDVTNVTRTIAQPVQNVSGNASEITTRAGRNLQMQTSNINSAENFSQQLQRANMITQNHQLNEDQVSYVGNNLNAKFMPINSMNNAQLTSNQQTYMNRSNNISLSGTPVPQIQSNYENTTFDNQLQRANNNMITQNHQLNEDQVSYVGNNLNATFMPINSMNNAQFTSNQQTYNHPNDTRLIQNQLYQQTPDHNVINQNNSIHIQHPTLSV
uniref:Uncharacterized protein n=1 Tax=Acrobeloides nanus TaxID=290746 RepID=A0A914EIQ1_9BILA